MPIRRGECYVPNYAQIIIHLSGSSDMVSARTHHGGRAPVVHVSGALTDISYRDEILQHRVIPHMNVNGGIFQHYNARPNVARAIRDILQRLNAQTSP